jgi:hypothetical protein
MQSGIFFVQARMAFEKEGMQFKNATCLKVFSYQRGRISSELKFQQGLLPLPDLSVVYRSMKAGQIVANKNDNRLSRMKPSS